MPFEFTQIRAPWPTFYSTHLLPKPEFDDARAIEGNILVNNKVEGGKVVYPTATLRKQLTLRFLLTKQKALEVQGIIKTFQGEIWEIKLYDDSLWLGALADNNFTQRGTRLLGDNTKTGGEEVDTTLVFSAQKVN